MRRIRLTKEEREIEREIDKYVPASPDALRRLERAINKARKTSLISLRINEQDLYKLKHIAAEEGLPYQTYMTSILHKYVNQQLLDSKAVEKVVNRLRFRSRE